MLSSVAFGQASPAADKTASQVSYILAGRLFDATSDSVRENVVIAVEDERIKSVGSAADVKIPPGAKVIDLSQATVLPGLIDCHTHLGSRADRYNEIYNFKDTPFDHAFAAVLNARKTLEAGFTSVRDVGSDPVSGGGFAQLDQRRLSGRPARRGQRSRHFHHRRPRRPEQLLAADAGHDVSRGARFARSRTAPTRFAT